MAVNLVQNALEQREMAVMDHDVHALAADMIVAHKRMKELERQIMRLHYSLSRHGDDETRTWEIERELDSLESRVWAERSYQALLETARDLLLDRADGSTVADVFSQANAVRTSRFGRDEPLDQIERDRIRPESRG